jgi:hypothetical protein
MPGKVGVKLISRRSATGKYHSVRELVFALLDKSGGVITKEAVEKVVRKEYPKSNFSSKNGKGGHFTWYKHRWNKLKLEGANFTLKEAKEVPAAGGDDERSGDESKESKTKRSKRVAPSSVGRSTTGRKGRRVQIQSKRKRMDVKARKATVQRKGNPKVPEQPEGTQEVHD